MYIFIQILYIILVQNCLAESYVDCASIHKNKQFTHMKKKVHAYFPTQSMFPFGFPTTLFNVLLKINIISS